MGIIWTRSADLWNEDKQYLSESECLRLPCLSYCDYPLEEILSQTRRLSFPKPSLAIGVLTSAHTITSLKKIPAVLTSCSRWYAVGKKTRDAFTQLMLSGTNITLPKGVKKGEDLATYLCGAHSGEALTFFLPGAKKRAYALDEHLQSCGFKTLSCDTYEVQSGIFNTSGEPIDKKGLEGSLASLNKPVVCFASPSAVLGFAKGLSSCGLASIIQSCVAVAIGPTTFRACQSYFSEVHESSEASLASLADLAKTL